MLSHHDIDAHIRAIVTGLNELAVSNNDARLSQCVKIDGMFQTLREQYSKEPTTLEGRVQELTSLKSRFRDLLAERVAPIVDRYYEVNEHLHAMEREKAFWRDTLIRTSTHQHRERLDGSTAFASVRSIPTRVMPSPGTAERGQLEEFIRKIGRWEDVSHISRAKLDRAVSQQLFGPVESARIEQLCPTSVAHQVSIRILRP